MIDQFNANFKWTSKSLMWSVYVLAFSKDTCLDQNISREKHFCLAENTSEFVFHAVSMQF